MIRRYLEGKASPQEASFVETYYDYFDHLDPENVTPETVQQEREDRMLGLLLARMTDGSDKALGLHRSLIFQRPAASLAAAAVIGLMVMGGWLWYRGAAVKNAQPPAVMAADLPPGGDKATLKLAGGRVIVLDSAGKGQLALQGQAAIVKVGKGQLAYKQLGTENDQAPVAYNVLSTPIGGQYQLVLPDGTTVWLNSASSIRYPTRFTGKQREVSVDGEAYFQVKQDEAMPFRVQVKNVSIQVLGTDFDVMAYEDEASINTTLVRGKVRVLAGDQVRGPKGGDQGTVLKPGEQAVVANGTGTTTVKAVDADGVIAWTRGYFEFDQTDVQTLMRQLRRWYGIEPEYRTNAAGRLFGGRINRSLKLSEVLELLKGNGIHFSIEGKKLIVLP